MAHGKGAYRASVRHRYGRKGFTKRGTIRSSVKHKDSHRNDHIGHMAQRALAFDVIRKRKR